MTTLFCQLNVSKMSINSEMVIDRFLGIHKIKAIALQETGCWNVSSGAFVGKKIFQNKTTSSSASTLSGVALIIDEDLKPELIHELSDDSVDAIWCQIKLNNKRILIGSVYCNPTPSSTQSLSSLLSNINIARNYKCKHGFNSLLVYGDYNARSLNWGDHTTNPRGKLLQEFVDKESLTICSPFDCTFVCSNGGSVIDLVLSEGPITSSLGLQWMEKEVELFTGAPRRGHYPVLQSMSERISQANIKQTRTDWKSADWKSWTAKIEANTWLLDLHPHIQANGRLHWESMLKIIEGATKSHIPEKLITVYSKPYWTKELSTLSQAVQRNRGLYSRRSTPQNRNSLDESTKKFKAALIAAKNSWVKERTEGLNTKDCITFWKRYKRVFGAKQDNSVCNLIDLDVLHTKDCEKEELLFNEFFTGKHLDNQASSPTFDSNIRRDYNTLLDELSRSDNSDVGNVEEETSVDTDAEITTDEIQEAIKKQDTHEKAPDRDNIHPIILKKLGPEAINALKSIYSWVLKEGIWLWDKSYVCFIRKEGKPSYAKPGAYRPITIASYIGKILERVLDRRWKNEMGLMDILDDDQEGFLEGRSTTRYLFRLLAHLTEVKRQKLACIILFIDFEKAFDSVHLPTLMVKLSRFGFSKKILKVIQNMLFNRKIALRVNGFLGKFRRCLEYGLPQGSVISPFLFILYITDMTNDYPEAVKHNLSCFKFADDGTMMITDDKLERCYLLMQQLCDSLSRWCTENKLVVNCGVNKTEAIIMKTGNESSEDYDPPELKINSRTIRYVRSTKVLGLILDDELSFRQHAEKKLKECNKKWGLITRSTNRNHGLNVRSLTLLLKTTTLTKLHYAAPLWLANNLNVYTSFWNKVIMKISGAMLNPHRETVELYLHLPPLEIQLQALTVKFLCKCLTAQDFVTSTLLQVEGSLQTEFHNQLSAIRNFLAWKNSPTVRSREIELTHQSVAELAMYTKMEIQEYQQKIWLDRINNRIQIRIHTSANDERLLNIINEIRRTHTILDKDNLIFNHNTTKGEDSVILDYIHGNSFLFGNIRGSRDQQEAPCYFCQEQYDSPQHQLLHCEELKDHTFSTITTEIENSNSTACIIEQVVVTGHLQKPFIERVQFLKGQHEFILEDDQ